MCEISSVRENLSDAQIANPDIVVLSDENIHGFDVAVEYFTFVNIVQTHAHLKKILPDFLLRERTRMHVVAESVVE